MRIRTICFLIAVVATVSGCAAKRGFYHRVAKGETLYRISKAYEMRIDEIGRANNIRDYGAIREGQYIFIPDPDGRPIKVGAKETGAASGTKTSRQSSSSRRTTVPQDAPDRLRAANLSGRFQWPLLNPLHHNVITGFGEIAKKRHTGVDIRAPQGTPVVAVAAGTVIYAGEKVQGLGKTVVIRHPEDIFSVYSHLQTIFVRINIAIEAQTPIGEIGLPSEMHFDQQQSMLHFELRERTIPVNPELLLP